MADEQQPPRDDGDVKIAYLQPNEDESELNRQVNESDETRLNLLRKELGKTHVIGTLRPPEYGQYGGQKACLPSQASDQASHAHPSANPEIVQFGPRKYFDTPAIETRERHHEIELNFSSGAAGAQAGAEARLGGSKSFQRDHRLSIVGLPDRPDKTWNRVEWLMHENRLLKTAMLNKLDVAMVVVYDRPFFAVVEVEVTNAGGITLFGWPWQKDDPILLNPPESSSTGTAPAHQFDQLSEEEWARMLDLQSQWQNQTASRTQAPAGQQTS